MQPPRLVVILALALAVILGRATPVAAGPSKAEARIAAAADAFAAVNARLDAGVSTPEQIYLWSVRWLDAERDAGRKGKALAAAAAAHLERMAALAVAVTKLVDAGRLSPVDRIAATYYRAEAELWVERKGKR